MGRTIARDRGCIRCGRSPRYCQAHHIVHWKNGGLTDLSNLVLMCRVNAGRRSRSGCGSFDAA
ncbi:MAG: HNH endonuclease [Micrococcales bacterium]|nr:HNH endonuclease [Micrococcales bacterium]